MHSLITSSAVNLTIPRVIGDRAQTVGAGMVIEQERLQPLPAEGFDLAELSFPIVDGKGCVKVKSNWYSMPVRAGTKVRAKAYADRIELWQEGDCVARHQRCYGVGQQILELEHYLAVLERKPGALRGSRPLQQWRAQGRWPASYDALWERLIQRQGKQEGTRAMIGLLQLGQKHGYQRLEASVEKALGLGCWDAAAVHYLLNVSGLERRPVVALEVGALARYERALPVVTGYDQLLSREVHP